MADHGPTLIKASCVMPGTTTASWAPLERADVGSNAIWEAGSLLPFAVTTTLFDNQVSCSPLLDLTNVFEAPESNIASVIAALIALSSRRLRSCEAFRCSLRLACMRESLEFDLGHGASATISWFIEWS